MTKKLSRSLFIFRRDLRLEDNTGLIFALKNSKSVIAAFILTPEQIEHNSFRSDYCLKFMIESLYDLENQLRKKNGKLYLFWGDPASILRKCICQFHIDALIVNRDYTPYSQQRDETLSSVCQEHGVGFYIFDDALLNPPENTLKKNGEPYLIFTPYFRSALQQKVLTPVSYEGNNFFTGSIAFAKPHSLLEKILPKTPKESPLKGGRSEALKILNNLKAFPLYEKLRDFPAEEYSTHLSPHLKFTTCSVREIYLSIYQNLKATHELIRSLYWRDFFTTLCFFFPHVFTGAYRTKFDQVKWSYNKNDFQKWCSGYTGFPIVDAGMREMNSTGFMHNRVRMLVASFLVKDLHINWQWGEKYFAQTLIDYDPSVNNANWQWVAGTGCAAQPYFRIFNPWSQQKKFDAECLYIKKWVPELAKLPLQAIHNWWNPVYQGPCPNYPAPIVDHEKASQQFLLSFRAITKKKDRAD